MEHILVVFTATTTILFPTYTTLTFVEATDETFYNPEDSSDEEYEGADQTEDIGASSGASSYEPSPQKKQKYPERSMNDYRGIVEYRNSVLLKKRSLSGIEKNFRWVRDSNHLNYIERVVKNAGTRIEKLNEINDYVLERF